MSANLKSLTRNMLEIAAGHRILRQSALGRQTRKRIAARLWRRREQNGPKETRFRYRWGTYW